MTDSDDQNVTTLRPYTEILGLPADQCPPHHYSLLGVELFCSHFERINQAVRKRYRTIREYHDHPDRKTREAVQDVMNAVAIARVVLTDPARKESYDIELAHRLGVDRESVLSDQLASPIPECQLIVVAGPRLIGQRHELVEGTDFTIGSNSNCSLLIDGSRAADVHATAWFTDGDWVIKPADREKIIQVNGTTTLEFVLAPGDLVDVGGYRLMFCGVQEKPDPRGSAPPLSMIMHKGISVAMPVFNALPSQRFVVGQSETALWQLSDPTISRHHCVVRTVGDAWEVEDMESTNGVQVNGVEVLRAVLADRDILTLGQFDILISLRY